MGKVLQEEDAAVVVILLPRGLWFMVSGFGFRVEGFELWVLGLGFRA